MSATKLSIVNFEFCFYEFSIMNLKKIPGMDECLAFRYKVFS